MFPRTEDEEKHKHAEKNPDEPDKTIYTDEQLENIVDSVMRMMDANGDGYVDYAEYRRSGVEENRRDDYPNGRPWSCALPFCFSVNKNTFFNLGERKLNAY